jgi:predicted enzyme related to lactoylglutathione lyase
MGPQWLAYFSVEDTDEMCRRATTLGGRVQIAPTESPHGRMALLRGRLGELFGVLEADDLT